MKPLVSVIVPCRDHARFLPDAIGSAYAQTVPCEIIVIDDGSQDETRDVIESYGSIVRPIVFDRPKGPAAARNAGIEAAKGGFIQFLDADDTLEPDKIEKQLAEMTPETGFVLCDVRIIDASGKETTASERYDYAHKRLDGWIQPWLGVANFIPVHSPLIRRSALGDIRFPDRSPEDWHFWYELAGVARCRYVPEVLCTYRKRRGGRNTRSRSERPGVVPPLRLNLGCGTPDARSWHPIGGFVNLDKSLGWRFEDGLRDFADGSVAAITVSHSLMYVREQDMPAVFDEFARVLQTGGVLRITEDDATNRASSRFGGWRGSESAIILTDARMMRRQMERVGFTVHDVTAETTQYADRSLLQAQHGDPPHCFWIEGVRECVVLFEPHADDAALFAAFSMIRHRPRVVTCFGSDGDYGDTETRHQESVAAAAILGAGPVEQWDGRDLIEKMRTLDANLRPARVFAPSPDTSHPDHLATAVAARSVFGERLTQYETYNVVGKVRGDNPVPFEPGWVELKRRALACYQTQINHPRASLFFTWPIDEWQE